MSARRQSSPVVYTVLMTILLSGWRSTVAHTLRRFPIPSFSTLGSFVFSYAADISVNPNSNPNSDIDLWPLNLKTVIPVGYPKIILYTKFEHFGVICFLSYAAENKQTDKQTVSKILPTPTDIVGVGNKHNQYRNSNYRHLHCVHCPETVTVVPYNFCQ